MPPANQMERPGSNRPSYTSQQSAPMPGVKTYNRPDGSNYFNPPSQQQQQPNFSAKFSMTPSGGNQGYPSPQMSGGGSKWQPMSKPPQPNSVSVYTNGRCVVFAVYTLDLWLTAASIYGI